MELFVIMFVSVVVSGTFYGVHRQNTKKEIETNKNVLDHRLEIRKLDDAKEKREQKLLGDGSVK